MRTTQEIIEQIEREHAAAQAGCRMGFGPVGSVLGIMAATGLIAIVDAFTCRFECHYEGFGSAGDEWLAGLALVAPMVFVTLRAWTHR